MALGGVVLSNYESTPSATSQAGLGAGDIISIKTTVRSGLDSEHHWPSTGGLSGAHRKGSARVFVGTTSQVSSVDTDGRLMFATDTFGLWYLSSASTILIPGSTLTAIASASRSASAVVSGSDSTTLNWTTSSVTAMGVSGQTITATTAGLYLVSWGIAMNTSAAIHEVTVSGGGNVASQHYSVSNTAYKPRGSSIHRLAASGTVTLSITNLSGSGMTLAACDIQVVRIQ